jgi:hypothetical protein
MGTGPLVLRKGKTAKLHRDVSGVAAFTLDPFYPPLSLSMIIGTYLAQVYLIGFAAPRFRYSSGTRFPT